MRPIEFRAWLKDEKKMIDVKAVDFDENGDVFSVNYPEGKSYCGYDRDNIELMQYTGLKDKNGVKIFEGDIVCVEDEICYVAWSEYYSAFVLRFTDCECNEDMLGDFESKYLEAIGNIYENPELLGD